MHISVVNEEADERFLVAETQMPKNWRQLTKLETDKIFGKDQPNNVKDPEDEGCDKSPGGEGAPERKECPPCNGMAVWWVTERYLNLWMADEPLSYAADFNSAPATSD